MTASQTGAVRPVPERLHTVTPRLVVADDRQPRFHGPPSRPGAGSPPSHRIHPPDG